MKNYFRLGVCVFLLSGYSWAAESVPPSPQSLSSYSSLKDFFQKTEANGYVRSYYFLRNYGNPVQFDQWAYSLGGMLNLRSADLYGFRADIAYYAADNLGFEAGKRNHRDRTLPPGSVNVLGQGFIQYEKPHWLVRAGNQSLETPWLNPADSRMIPALYQAAYVAYRPLEPLVFEVFRVFEYKDRTATQFTKSNLYTTNAPGSSSPVPSLFNVDVIGALAAGAKYDLAPVRANLWYYKFYNFNNLLYGDAEYEFRNSLHVNPIVAAQVAGEWGDGKNYSEEAGLGKPQAMVYGVLLGVKVPQGRVSVSYNALPIKQGAYRKGDIISPYTAGYQADPLYTTSMDAGLIERQAGHGCKLDGVYHFFDEQLSTEMSYSKLYVAAPSHNTSEVDFDVTYEFKHHLLKGFSLRNRLGILNGDVARGRFLYYRLMLEYLF